MEEVLKSINDFFRFAEPVSDFFWDFPTNFSWYSNIPILGKFSFAILFLIGMGIYFSVRTRFIQVASFSKTLGIMLRKKPTSVGISAAASFMLGLAMRVGPGNIVGVTGAISVGGPGALFWMWVAAFFGMSTAFMESVLAQLFKEKNGDDFVGGLPFYGKKVLGNWRGIGVFLALVFVIYALFNVPIQTFNIFTAVGAIAETFNGAPIDRQSTLYYGTALIIIVLGAFIILGGIKRVALFADLFVPTMTVLFCLMSLTIIFINYDLIPYFFKEVLVGAFSPHAIFGGAIGTAIAQGVKRGLMSNEAGQGTITMAAAAADNKHPCEQGFVQSFGVFLDTMVICSMTGFVVVMAHVWDGVLDTAAWEAMRTAKINVYMLSVRHLVPEMVGDFVTVIMSVCYALFAFTTLLGMISFAEISANFISRSKRFIVWIRIIGALFFVPFGSLAFLARLELPNLWAISDLMNIILVYLNIPILLMGAHYVYKALDHYRKTEGGKFVSAEEGFETAYWTKNP